MSFSDILGGVSTAGNIVTSLLGMNQANRNTQKMIDAQKQMNQANIASQEKINQQNIDFQQGINDIMRHDANNAISIKKQDMINAGYSTADPNMQGNSIAQLGSPQLQAPQVESEFTPDMANYQQNATNNFAQSLLDSTKNLADISLMKAQTRLNKANATNAEIDSLFNAAHHNRELQNQALAFTNMLKDIDVKDETKKKIAQETNYLWVQTEYVAEEVTKLRVDNQFNFEKNKTELDNLKKVGKEIDAKISNLNSVTDINQIEKEIKGFERDIMEVKSILAEFGINFDSGNILSTLFSVVKSPRGSEIGKDTAIFVCDLVKHMIKGIWPGEDPSQNPVVKGLTSGLSNPGSGWMTDR